MNQRIKASVLMTLGLFSMAVVGSAWWFAANMKKAGYVNPRPGEGLHPRTESPYAKRHWMDLYGDPREEFGLAFTDVEFDAVDGSTLRGWLVPSPGSRRAAVVTVHGGEGDRRTFMRQLPMLHRAGYGVLLFDYREHGISDGASRGIAFGWRANHDVSSAVSFVRNAAGYERVAVLGTSMGAVSALIAAAKDPSIDVVLAENPFATANDVLGESDFFGVLPRWYRELILAFMRLRFDVWSEPDAIEVVDRVSPRPILFMHGTADQSVGVWQTELLYNQAKDPKDLWILDGAEHTALFNQAPLEYERRVVGFLNRHLLQQGVGLTK